MDLKIPTLDNIKGIKGIKEKMGFGEQPASTRSRGAHSSRVDSYEEEDYGYEDYGEYAFDDTADYAQPFNNEAPVGAAHGIGSSFSPVAQTGYGRRRARAYAIHARRTRRPRRARAFP